MKKVTMLIVGFCMGYLQASAQKDALNIPGLLQLVSYSKSENKLQVKARDRQAQVTANEEANKTLLAKLKTTYRTVQQRYNLLGTAINAADVGFQATPLLNQIISSQQELIGMAGQDPALVPIALDTELAFAQHSRSLVQYLIGLCLSIGDVNQMKASDRKVLFDYVLLELSSIAELSNNRVGTVRNAAMKKLIDRVNPFADFINRDKQLAGEIIQNAKLLKR